MFVRQHPQAHVLQTSAWAALKAPAGWSSVRVALQTDSGQLAAGAQVLLRPLPLRLGHMAYLPMGPLVSAPDQAAPLWAAIDRSARQHGAAFLKWEPGFVPAGSPWGV